MKKFVLAFLFPWFLYSQTDQYLTVQTEVDARNALFGGTVNERGYNGVYKVDFSAQWFREDAFYETFARLNYETAGMDLIYLLNYNKAFKQGAGIQISFIDKPRKVTPSLGLNIFGIPFQ